MDHHAPDNEADAAPLYPPTVIPPPAPLGLPRYVLTFIGNPLRVMPEAVYREPIVQNGTRSTWVMGPDLIKRVLLDDREDFPKTHVEGRINPVGIVEARVDFVPAVCISAEFIEECVATGEYFRMR